MEKTMETIRMGLRRVQGLEGMEKNMETTRMDHIGTTLRIHSFIPF